MKFGSTLPVGVIAWCASIGVLHDYFNWEEQRDDGSFRVGFLPVT